jgi:hypothetical protein
VINVNANKKNARGASPTFAVKRRSACRELAIIVSLIRFFKLAGIIGEWREDCQPRGICREAAMSSSTTAIKSARVDSLDLHFER